ncbi:hypothetical protein GCM10009759_50540 [Kitasatospora saccharophila]|uniref:Uncharacterized protein n=1 Tax=Kitasatospora saccharophila TaxID=407973 RepID=A0ABN2XDG2_9ACTN
MAATVDAPWTVTLDYSHDAALALAVRDALGLTDPLGLPPVDPPLALASLAHPTGPGPAAQWPAWWDGALTEARHGSGAFAELDGPLGAFVREHGTELLRWSSARKRELAARSRPAPGRPRLADALRERTGRTGVRLPAFRLLVLALPVAGPLFRPVRDGLTVTSTALVGDRDAYLAALADHLVRTHG